MADQRLHVYWLKPMQSPAIIPNRYNVDTGEYRGQIDPLATSIVLNIQGWVRWDPTVDFYEAVVKHLDMNSATFTENENLFGPGSGVLRQDTPGILRITPTVGWGTDMEYVLGSRRPRYARPRFQLSVLCGKGREYYSTAAMRLNEAIDICARSWDTDIPAVLPAVV